MERSGHPSLVTSGDTPRAFHFNALTRFSRVKYEQTIAHVKSAVSEKLHLPVEKIQLFWHKKELTSDFDNKTLLEMNLHTGFSLRGYDLVNSQKLHDLSNSLTCAE